MPTHIWLGIVMLMACAWPPLFIRTTFTLSPDIAPYLHVSTSLLSSGWRLWPGYYCCVKTRIVSSTLRSTSGLCLELLSINQISWLNGQGEVSWLEFFMQFWHHLGLYLDFHNKIEICVDIRDLHSYPLGQMRTIDSHMHPSLQNRQV